jgi:hypothetical protein
VEISDLLVGSAKRAADILEFWKRLDLCGLEAELDRTRRACTASTAASFEEQERMELLGGIAGQIQDGIRNLDGPGESAETCFRLLEHLAASGKCSVIRFETLSSSRY